MSLSARISLKRDDFLLDAAVDAPAASITAIYGPSGSGKTTLLNAIAGLVEGVQGRITVGDETWQNGGVGLAAHRRRVGYVFQESRLFSHLDVYRNLMYGARRRAYQRRAHDVIEMLDLKSLLKRRPAELSGGEQRRVSLGRALLADPALLLLDEPLSGIDEARKEEIYPYLERLQSQLEIPALLVTHSVDELLRLADRVVRIRGGHLDPARSLDAFEDAAGRGPWSVLECRVAGYDPDDRLLELAVGPHRLLLPAPARPPVDRVRAIIAARDVSLVVGPDAPSSILNRLEARVIQVEPKDTTAVISLALGAQRLKARVSLRSVRELKLGVGTLARAQIKAVSVRSSFTHR